MNYEWERLAERVARTRLPFLDVTVGLVWGSGGVLLIDAGTTLTEAHAVDDDVRTLTERHVSHIVLTHNHFDHILGSSAFAGAAIYAAPEVAETLGHRTGHLRDDAMRHGADPDEIDRAIAALRPPDHQILEAVIDLGDRTATLSHPGGGHTTHDVIVAVPNHRTVVFCGDLVEESGDPAVDDDSDLAAWPATLDRVVEAGGEMRSSCPATTRLSTSISSVANRTGCATLSANSANTSIARPAQHRYSFAARRALGRDARLPENR